MYEEASEMMTYEQADRIIQDQLAAVIHECKACHRLYSRAAWNRCHLVTNARALDGRGSGLEFRDCPGCLSTMAIETEILDAD